MRLAIVLLPLVVGCTSVPRQGIQQVPQQQQASVPEDVKKIREEIQQYHNWLERTRRLLGRVPHYKDWPEPRQLDPDTLEPIPKPEQKQPSTEELKQRLNEMLKDPEFHKQFNENKGPLVEMPAGARPLRPRRS